MKKAYYKCIRCGEIKGPFIIQNGQKPTFGQCNSCQYNGQFILEKLKTIYRNFQKMTIQ
jgi:DNA replicative helicase MCM subunit Mcm2 (Cdc46/Mcm family)